MKVIEALTGIPLQEINKQICNLPVREGGLGIPKQADVADRAWTASFSSFYRKTKDMTFHSLPQHFRDLIMTIVALHI